MAVSTRHFNVIILFASAYILALDRASQAWSNIIVKKRPTRIDGFALNMSSMSHSRSQSPSYQLDNCNQDQQTQDSFKNAANDSTESDTNLRLQNALKVAREADRKFGLCSPASNTAWKIVDDAYLTSAARQKVEDSLKRVLGEEESIWEQHI